MLGGDGSIEEGSFHESLLMLKTLDLSTLVIIENNDLLIETATAVNQQNPTIPGYGNEPYVIGAAFSLEENTL